MLVWLENILNLTEHISAKAVRKDWVYSYMEWQISYQSADHSFQHLSTHKIIKNQNDPKMSLLMLYHISVSSANQILLIDSIHWYTVMKPAHIGFIKSFIQFKFFSCYQNTILSPSLKEKYASSMVRYILPSKE